MPDVIAGTEQDRSSSIERDIQQGTVQVVFMPRNKEAPSIRGPVYAHQAVPSFHDQITRFAGGCGAELDGSLVEAISNDGSPRTVAGQGPIAGGIDLRRVCTFPAPHVEPERFRSISLHDAVQAGGRWQPRTLHVPDANVFEDQARSSAAYGNGENRGGSFRAGRFRSGNVQRPQSRRASLWVVRAAP